MNSNEFYNKTQTVIYDGGTVSFIIQTDGEPDFWSWSVGWRDVADYFQTRGNKAALNELVNENLSTRNCNIFVNDCENDTLGSSSGFYATIEDTIKGLG